VEAFNPALLLINLQNVNDPSLPLINSKTVSIVRNVVMRKFVLEREI
jgi:hypothetical protein